MRQHQPGRATHAQEAGAGWQRKAAGAVDAGREQQRYAGARRLIDGALHGAALIAGSAGAHAEMRGVEAERRKRRGFGRRGESGGAGRGGGDEMAAVQVHAPGILHPRWLTPC